MTDQVVLRHDSFEKTPLQEDEQLLLLEECLDRIREQGRGVKLDLKQNSHLLDAVLERVAMNGIGDSQLWFNGNVERLRESGFRKLSKAHPSAIIQCPVDFLAPLILGTPEKAREVLKMFIDWGVNRFSLSWLTPEKRRLFDQINQWGFEVNIYDVPDLEAFLQATLLLPRSITSDFNFPKWNYYGQGSGENLVRYEYLVRPTVAVPLG